MVHHHQTLCSQLAKRPVKDSSWYYQIDSQPLRSTSALAMERPFGRLNQAYLILAREFSSRRNSTERWEFTQADLVVL